MTSTHRIRKSAAATWVTLLLLVGACTADATPTSTCGPGTALVGGECTLVDGGGARTDGSRPAIDAGTVDAADAADASAAADAEAVLGDAGPTSPPDAGAPAAGCGDGVCAPARASDDLADVESCATCAADCSTRCGAHQCSWIFYCARERMCTGVECVAECMPEGDAVAQGQYLGLYACMQLRCASVCFDGHLGGGCTSCVCSECPTEAAACGGLTCT